jgi:demethylmenaquinone methyltransferase/2-methoxy-6-polyprenyl-1,4-benzoquinol methylase
MTVADLMAGSGESWDYILPKVGKTGTVHAIDFSDKMVEHAEQRRREKFSDYQVNVLNQDATKTTLESGSVDLVHSGYGVKTLPRELRPALAAEVSRLLKPGGKAVFVEATLPKNPLLAFAQNVYMNKVIPFVMKFLPGEYSAFLMINRYLRDFKNMDELAAVFKAQGLRVTVKPLFGGIAAVLTAEKPAP